MELREKIEQMIGEVVLPEEEGLAGPPADTAPISRDPDALRG